MIILKVFINNYSLGLLFVLQSFSMNLFAQDTSTITGKVFDAKNNEPLPFATIFITDISDTVSQQMRGTISDDNGNFTIDQIQNGKYNLQVYSVGFKKAIKTFEISSSKVIDAGTFSLQDSSLLIAETIIAADRVKGKSETDKNIYYINNKILSATGNSRDLLRYIPGVQVDL